MNIDDLEQHSFSMYTKFYKQVTCPLKGLSENFAYIINGWSPEADAVTQWWLDSCSQNFGVKTSSQ